MWGKCKFRVEKFKFDLGRVEHRCSKVVEYAVLALKRKTQVGGVYFVNFLHIGIL